MKNKKFGFTLIELLVVIVIIGILATLSTATFSGYFKKARDMERQTFVRNVQQIIMADNLTEDSPDYSTKYDTTAKVESLLQDQGYDLLEEKNSIEAFLLTTTEEVYKNQFLVIACREENEGFLSAEAATDGSDFFFAGTAGFNLGPAPYVTGTDVGFAMDSNYAAIMCAANTETTAASLNGFFDIGVESHSNVVETEVRISQ